jgi:hypothetical protein
MGLLRNQMAFAFNVSKLIAFMYEKGFSVTLGEAERTPEQARLNAQRGIGIAKSLHCDRLAIDLNLFDSSAAYCMDKESYQQFGDYWKSLDPANRWGGDFKRLVDSNHFEMQNV